ncbi:MAG: hypothetical protein WAK03_02035 [Methylocystis sp.]
MLRRLAMLCALAAALAFPGEASAGCRYGRYWSACHHRDHYVWHPEWGAYGLWGYGACWRWDFGTDRWVNICY